MKYLLLSIHAEYTKLIFSGEKLAEIRKTAPAESIIEENAFIRVILYETKAGGGCGAVVGWFDMRNVKKINSERSEEYKEDIARWACLTVEQLEKYRAGGKISAWVIGSKARLEKPLQLEFFGLQRAPQSWQWIKTPEQTMVRVEVDGQIHISKYI